MSDRTQRIAADHDVHDSESYVDALDVLLADFESLEIADEAIGGRIAAR